MAVDARPGAGIEVRPVRPEECEEAGRATRAGFAALFGEDGRAHEDETEYLEVVADIAGRMERTTVLVAVGEEGRILGSVTVELNAKVNPEQQLAPDEAHLRMLAVSPQAQRRGAGRALMEAAAALARAAGKQRLTLHTMPEMTAARRLYEAIGYQGGAPVEVSPGHCRLTYELPLSPATPEP
jgi:ribosomal protein S18 acetylase RimI-like enzyme